MASMASGGGGSNNLAPAPPTNDLRIQRLNYIRKTDANMFQLKSQSVSGQIPASA